METQGSHPLLLRACRRPHSLGKLIEWKLDDSEYIPTLKLLEARSPLAGETN